MKRHFFQNGLVDPGSMLNAVREIDPYNNISYKLQDELSLSKLFADILCDVLRYNTTQKEWNRYDGIVWRRDPGGMFAKKCAQLFQRALFSYSGDINDHSYQKFIVQLGKNEKRKSLIEDAKSYYCFSSEDLDADLNLFNCQNCVIKLDTLETIEHSPDLLLSKVANVFYDKEAHSKMWEEFIFSVMCGIEEKIMYLQELFGYAMTGEVFKEEFYILYGKTTRNGKSTLLETMGNIFGDYSMCAQPETISRKNTNTSTASGDIARLDGCRLLRTSEPPKNMLFNDNLVKNMTGGDTITARRLYEREVEFKPIFKLFMNTNYLPIITDQTMFTSDRVKVITFDRHFEPEEQDLKLKSKLLSEKNKSGILNWTLEGLRRFHANGDTLTVPLCVQNATEDYQENSDKIQNFIRDCLEADFNSNLQGKEVYSKYSLWCEDSGYTAENRNNFFEDLRRRGIMSKSGTVNGVTMRNVVKGYRIKQNDSQAVKQYPFGMGNFA